MVRKFLKDVRGTYTIATVIAMVPILGGLALAIDFSEMNRQRQATLHALDAAGLAAAWRFDDGATDEELKVYAKEFFEANLGPVAPEDTVLHVTLPNSTSGGGTLKMSADLIYKPYFYPAFVSLLKGVGGSTTINFTAETEIRLKNTLEVALVLDNSGSMDVTGTGSGQKRIDLLKAAAKQLVDTIAADAYKIKQVEKPVQFALVPFAAAVNVGPDNAEKSWMDTDGVSPIHHENFNWPATFASDKTIEFIGGVYRKQGDGWGEAEGRIVTRFTLFDELKRVIDVDWTDNWVCDDWDDGRCDDWDNEPIAEYTYDSFARWEGCVEARPNPYNVTDAASVASLPATLFVPMFAPDETDLRYDGDSAYNNWWRDITTNSSSRTRQRYMPKYFEPAPLKSNGNAQSKMGLDEGPNASCTTKPITPLVDVSNSAGVTKIKSAIDSMAPLGGTNVPEGIAWGWRVVSGGAPFTEGRPDTNKGNDKVVIVLTDGENTYYTPQSLGAPDLANNGSIYSAFGYTRQPYNGGDTRLFRGTSSAVGKSDFSNDNYGIALNEQMAAACANAKATGLVVMTVALDLDPKKEAQKKQIEGLKACASNSRVRRDEKLFWNTSGGDLADTFKKIADELSNLRIVG